MTSPLPAQDAMPGAAPEPFDATATTSVTATEPNPVVGRRDAGVPARRSELMTAQGRTAIADSVVAKISGLAAREIAGVHDMGVGVSRAFGALKERLPIGSNEPSPTRGVNVEVGERQAAVDLDVVVEYGAAIVEVAEAIRRNVISKVEAMTGLEVTEVNITIDDVYLGDDEEPQPARVQ
jgi:uncharacterized alkaline shock family protein YloU